MRNGALADPAVQTIWVEALFVSDLQPSSNPTADQIRAAVTQVLSKHGDECAGIVAYECGRHPDTATHRITWCRGCVEALAPAPADA